MYWRDIKAKQPTNSDANAAGRVLMLHADGSVGELPIHTRSKVVGWMPCRELPTFRPSPDLPPGYRFVDNETEEPRKDCKFWDVATQDWGIRFDASARYDPCRVYIVPVDPPKPQYRAFAKAEEFKEYRKTWVMISGAWHLPHYYSDNGVQLFQHFYRWNEAFKVATFEDGTPFGVRVS